MNKREFINMWMLSQNRVMGKKIFKKSQRGLTLIETLVALFILSMGVVAAFSLISKNMATANLIKNEMIASRLAEEGAEIVRNIRDTDWHLGNPFGASVLNGTWEVEWNSLGLMPDASRFLKIDGSNGRYNYSSGNNSLFKRTVTVANGPNGGSVSKIITSTVNWSERGFNRSISSELHLYDWK